MNKVNKYLMGSIIITIIFVLAIFTINAINNKKVKDKEETQKKQAVSQVIKTEDLTKKDTTKTSSVISNVDKKQIEILVNKYYDISHKFQSDIFTSETQDKVKELFTKKKEFIASYKNKVNYIKQGLTDNTYVVFTVYDIKLKNIKTLVPGMSVLSVVKDEQGEFLINNNPYSDDLVTYIKKMAEDDSFQKTIELVNSRLKEALKKDASLKKFVTYIKEIS